MQIFRGFGAGLARVWRARLCEIIQKVEHQASNNTISEI